MQVKILHDTPLYKAGTTPHLRTETAQSLLDLGYAEPYTPPLPPLEMHYAIDVPELTQRVTLRASCNRCPAAPHGRYSFFGDADLLISERRYDFQHQCGLPPTRIPVDWVERYRAARAGTVYTPVRGEMGLFEADVLSNRQAKKIDGAKLDAQIALEKKQRKALGARY